MSCVPVPQPQGEGPIGFGRGPVRRIGVDLHGVGHVLNGLLALFEDVLKHVGQEISKKFHVFGVHASLLARQPRHAGGLKRDSLYIKAERT